MAKKYKIKTNRAAAKRYRLSGSGKVKVGRKGKRHNLSSKGRNRNRTLRGSTYLQTGDEGLAKVMIPYK